LGTGQLAAQIPRIAWEGLAPLVPTDQLCSGRKRGHSLRRRVCLVFDCKGNPSAHKPEFTLRISAHRNQSYGNNNSRGFTLIELLIGLAIIATLLAIAIPNLMSALYQAKVAHAVGDITSIETDIIWYQSVNNQYPNDLATIGDDTILDPWGRPYQYLNHATAHGNGQFRKDRFLVPLNSDYDLYSMGADGQSVGPITASKSQDDIIRASNGSYVGLASQF
jgi:general secretion pathway protein G